jgi:hypothetical protein
MMNKGTLTLTLKYKVHVNVVACICLVFNLSSCEKNQNQKNPIPPDLSHCTKIEIKYYPSTLESMCFGDRYQVLLSESEKQYLESLKTIVVNDPEQIKKLAHDLSLGSYDGTNISLFRERIADVICYQNNNSITSFRDYFPYICDKNGHWFRYKKRKVGLMKLTPQLRPFLLRTRCAFHLSDCKSRLRLFFDDKGKEYSPSKWCDAIVHAYRASNISKKEIMGAFKCPGAGKGKCHYAMNTNCKPDSSPDMVHLFETKAGWNQNGGPELFTFDNHEPKGGCVILNDGTVKFIRTKEELQQLRWK